jgi:hypothetical protein
MKVFTYSEARQNLAKLLDLAYEHKPVPKTFWTRSRIPVPAPE